MLSVITSHENLPSRSELAGAGPWLWEQQHETVREEWQLRWRVTEQQNYKWQPLGITQLEALKALCNTWLTLFVCFISEAALSNGNAKRWWYGIVNKIKLYVPWYCYRGFSGFLKMKLLNCEAVGYVPQLYTTFAVRQWKATRDFRCYEGLQEWSEEL